MSVSLLREHIREYHGYRWKQAIISNPSLNNFANTVIQNPPPQKQRKIIGKKIKRKIKTERKKIVTYQKKVTQNVRHNLSILQKLMIQTNRNVPQWQERLQLIKNTTHSLGKK